MINLLSFILISYCLLFSLNTDKAVVLTELNWELGLHCRLLWESTECVREYVMSFDSTQGTFHWLVTNRFEPWSIISSGKCQGNLSTGCAYLFHVSGFVKWDYWNVFTCLMFLIFAVAILQNIIVYCVTRHGHNFNTLILCIVFTHIMFGIQRMKVGTKRNHKRLFDRQWHWC